MSSEFEPYLRGWRARERSRDQARRERARAARSVAERLADLLVGRYGARRVWLVGSLVEPTWFHERSDIDLVCEGIPPAQVADADVAAWIEAAGFDVDLLPIEEAPPSVHARVAREGVLLRG